MKDEILYRSFRTARCLVKDTGTNDTALTGKTDLKHLITSQHIKVVPNLRRRGNEA
jgi:hypothetical protein